MACFSCRTPFLETANPSRTRRLTAKLDGSNIRLGEAIRDIGMKCRSQNWPHQACCYDCFKLLQRISNVKQRVNNVTMEWRERTGHRVSMKPPNRDRKSIRQRMIRYILTGHYFDVVRCLALFEAGRAGMQRYLTRKVTKEIKGLVKRRQPKFADLKHFHWEEWNKDTEETAPMLYNIIKSALGPIDDETLATHNARLGIIMQIFTFTRNTRKCNFIQKFLGMQLWRCGASGKVMKALSRLGLSQHPDTARKTVDTVNEDACKELEIWRDSSTPGSGFSICVDNVRWLSRASRFSSSKGNKMIVKCNSFALKDRVPFDGPNGGERVSAAEMPLHTFLPSQQDYDQLKHRMIVIVQRILQKQTTMYNSAPAELHIPHEYTRESKLKSEYINTGIINANPGEVDGSIDVMTDINGFVKQPTPVHGDCGAVRLLEKARCLRCIEVTVKDRFRDLIPVPQEFHFRAVTMEDTLKEFYDGTRPEDRGTLKQLQGYFGHKSVSSDIMKNFNHASDFLLFITLAFTTGMAAEIVGRKKLDGTSQPVQDSLELATNIVNRVWRQLPMSHVSNTMDAVCDGHKDIYCFCKKDTGEELIECSNLYCNSGRWFHTKCVGNPDSNADWYCSNMCRVSGFSSLCVCRQKKDGPTITCSNRKCARGSVFHKGCVNVNESGKGRWFCSNSCKRAGDPAMDDVKAYVDEVLWRCLLHEAYRDAEREGDGLAMMAHWRIYMPDLWNRKHTNYVWVAHRLLAQASGFTSKCLAHHIVHNRTVNLTGQPGRNLAIDMFMEIMNHEFKDVLRHARGRYTQQSVKRAGRIIGSLGRELDRIFAMQISESAEFDGRHSESRYASYQDDVRRFLDEFAEDDLFKEKRRRKLHRTSNKHASEGIWDAAQLKRCLIKHSGTMDLDFDIAENSREDCISC